MNLIQSPQKAVSVWLLAIASALAGLELFLPQLEAVMPEHWYAIALPVILIARVISQGLGGHPATKREPVRVVERGWAPFYLLPLVALFALVSLFLIACGARLSETEVRCIAGVEARESVELALCGKDTSGECSTDAIMDKYDPQAEACVTGGAK